MQNAISGNINQPSDIGRLRELFFIQALAGAKKKRLLIAT